MSEVPTETREVPTTACEHCRATAELETYITPVGTHHGAKMYRCTACNRFTWERWEHTGGPVTPPPVRSRA